MLFLFFKIFFSNFNYIDIFALAVILTYVIEGYSVGFIRGFLDFLTFIASLILALKFYVIPQSFFAKLNLPLSLINIIDFIAIAVISEMVLKKIASLIYKKLISSDFKNDFYFLKKINQVLGGIVAVFSSFILISVLFAFFILLPVSTPIKNGINKSFLGKILIPDFQNLNNFISPNIDHSSFLFLSVDQNPSQPDKLGFTFLNPTEDKQGETQMLDLLNKTRVENGRAPLILDWNLSLIAFKHGQDMLKNNYFSHNDLNGRSFNQRFSDNEILYNYAGENLAFAPNATIAFNGLMASPGHRANILSINFKKVGISVLDAGNYGKMFIQDFTD